MRRKMSDERLTTDAAIKYLESIIYEDFAPYTQKCLLKVIEAARKEEPMTADWEKRIERIVEKLEERQKAFICKNTEPCDYPERLGCCYDRAINDAIDIVKAGGADETD